MSSLVVSQTLTNHVVKAMYWFNSATPVNAVEVSGTYDSDSRTTDFTISNISTSGMSNGLQLMYVAVQDSLGAWGTPQIRSFMIGSFSATHIVKLRYWFNSNTPTEISTTPTYNADSTIASWQNLSFDASALPIGTHKLYVSVLDGKGNWSSPRVTTFNVLTVTKKYISKGQYWFDSATPTGSDFVDPTYNADSSNVSFNLSNISTSGLSNGLHKFYFRMQEANGKWGSAQVSHFSINSLEKKYAVHGQYWFNSPTPTADTVGFEVTQTGDSSKYSASLSNVQIPSGLENGMHTLYARFQTADGKWGAAQTIQFVQDASLAPPTIAQMEYYFGNSDPGIGKATPPNQGTATGFGGRSVTYKDTFSVQQQSFPLGVNKFSVRFKSNKEEWGPTISKSFSVLTRAELISSTDSLNYGNLYSRRDTITKWFFIRNNGDADLKVKVKSLPSTQWKVKFAGNKDSVTIAKDSYATDSVQVFVTYTPVRAGAVNSSIQFTTNDSVKSFLYTLPVTAMADSAVGKLAISVDTVNFGLVSVNVKKRVTLIVSNIGVDSLKIQTSNVLLYGNFFKLPQTNSFKTIGFQKSTDTIQVHIDFTPAYTGTFNTYFYLNAYNTKMQYLEGTTIYVQATAINIQHPTIQVDNSLMNFGGVSAKAPASDSVDKTLSITNLGQTQLRIDSIAIGDSAFKLISPASFPFVINNGFPQDAVIRFKPPVGIFTTYSTQLKIYNNSTDSNQVVVVPLTGDATNGPPLAVLSLSDSTLDFGSVTSGFSSTKNITITNAGANKALNISSLSLTQGSFTTTVSTPLQIAPDSAKMIPITFSPNVLGNISGTLHIVSDATSRGTRDVSLKGIGVSTPTPIIEVQLSSLAFGATKVQTTNAVYYKIKNAGNDTLKVDSIYTAKKSLSVFTVNKNKLTIAPNVTDSLLVSFTPLAETQYSDSLILVSNVPRFSVPLSGSGAQLAIQIDTNVTQPNPIVQSNQAHSIGVKLSASLGSSSVAYLFYKSSGAVKFDSLQMTTSDHIRFQGQIPAVKIGTVGSAYYIKITNGIETVTIPSLNPETNPLFVAVGFSGTGIQPQNPQPVVISSETNKQKFYRMISVPLDGITGTTDVILKNFGAYGKEKWRLFRYQAGQYIEHTNPSFEAFSAGRGYWFITTVNGKLQSGSGKSTSASLPFSIALQPEWNQIGNPFAFPVRWSDVTNTSLIGQPFAFNPTTVDYDVATSLVPWQGYFVKNNSSNPITIGIQPKDTSASPAPLPKFGKDGAPILAEKEWMLQLKATDGEISDNHNYIGVKKNASDEYDANDIEESPRQPGEYLKLSFDNSLWTERPDFYGYDFKSLSENGKFWDFTVNTNSTKNSLKISASAFQSVPESFEIMLLEKDAGIAQDLRRKNTFELPIQKQGTTKHFRIIIGSKEFVEKNNFGIRAVPQEYTLYQNYPNPFNPTTTIRFALPFVSNVEVKIFNMLGQEVKTLRSEVMNEGYYLTSWDGTNGLQQKVSSGIYFCRISARSVDGTQHYVHTMKMNLMK